MMSPSKLLPIIKDNLVLWFDPIYYTTDGGIIGIRDNSATNNTISAATSVTINTGPPSSYVFNGSDYVIYNTNSVFAPGTGDFTVSVWFIESVTQGILIDTRHIGSGSYFGFSLFINSSGNYCFFNGGLTTTITSTLVVKLNKWSQFTVTRISGTISLYVNGVLSTTATDSSNFVETTLLLGRNCNSSGTTYLTGNIGQVLVYKGLGLTQSQVTQNYSASRIYYGV